MSNLKVNSIIPDGFGNGVLLKSTKIQTNKIVNVQWFNAQKHKS